MFTRKRSLTAAAIVAGVAGLLGTAVPATAARGGGVPMTNSNGAWLWNDDGSTCASGTINLTVDWTRTGDRSGRVDRVTAYNATIGDHARGITFSEVYVTTGRTRFESFSAGDGVDISPQHRLYMGGNGREHGTVFYVVGKAYATTRPSCTGTVVVPLPGIGQ